MSEIRDIRKRGWFWVGNNVVDDYMEQIGPYGFTIYAALCRMANSQNQSTICTVKRIIEKTGICERMVREKIHQLHDLKLIHIEERFQNHAHIANVYTIVDPPVQEVVHAVQEGGAQEEGRVVHKKPGLINTSSSQDVLINTYCAFPKNAPTTPSDEGKEDTNGSEGEGSGNGLVTAQYIPVRYSAGFERFWKVYPRKTGKDKAWESWKKRKCEAIAEEITTAVHHHRKAPQWKDPQYIPLPTTFLNQGRWKDELVEEFIEWCDCHHLEIGTVEWEAAHPGGGLMLCESVSESVTSAIDKETEW